MARKGFVCYRLHLHQERAVERVGIVSTKCDISLPLKAISDELFFLFFIIVNLFYSQSFYTEIANNNLV